MLFSSTQLEIMDSSWKEEEKKKNGNCTMRLPRYSCLGIQGTDLGITHVPCGYVIVQEPDASWTEAVLGRERSR